MLTSFLTSFLLVFILLNFNVSPQIFAFLSVVVVKLH